jgi:hypothetical protein
LPLGLLLETTNIDLVGVQGINLLRFHVTNMLEQHVHLALILALQLDRNEKEEIKFLWLLSNCIHMSKLGQCYSKEIRINVENLVPYTSFAKQDTCA